MPALVKLNPRNRAGTYLNLGEAVNRCNFAKHSLFVELTVGAMEIIAGPTDVSPDGSVKKGQTVKIFIDKKIKVSVYNALIEVNPWLFEHAMVQWKRLLHPGEGEDFSIIATAYKPFNLIDLPGGWLVQISLID